MADQLASPEDLASLLQRSDLDLSTATLLVEIGTAVVQAEVRQRIVEVTETTSILGTTDSWLDLPERPVTTVTTVELDGTALTVGVPGSGGTTYRVNGSRLWRGDGWQVYCGEPSTVEVTYTHGYATGVQKLQLARGAVLGIIRDWYDNPSAVTSEKIDDYAATYSALAARLEASTHLRNALRRQYGRRGGLVRIG
jgi:hypothetical protein